MDENVIISSLESASTPAMDQLLRIYADSIPPAERKTTGSIAASFANPIYEFLVASIGDAVVGFAILACMKDAALLEYLAVDAGMRGLGIGSKLFAATCQRATSRCRLMLVEVETRESACSEDNEQARRQLFYKRMGCHQVGGVSYVMPPVAEELPPKFDLFACGVAQPKEINKQDLRRWLTAIYVEIYGQRSDDLRIEEMLANLPDPITLT